MDSGIVKLIAVGILQTLYMTLGSALLAYLIGLPVGVVLYATDRGGVWENRIVNRVLGILVNFLRSVPFIILLIWVLPVTRAIVGTSIGSTATIVPLVISAAPFVARMVESSLKEVDAGVIEAAHAMGASPIQIITKVLLPEALPSLVVGSSIAVTTILGYSAMSGFTGGGGLGAIAINYGYYRYKYLVMIIAVILLILLVQIFQTMGTRLAVKLDKRLKR